MIEALLVMMNNYFHDLAVAFLFASSLLSHVILRHWPQPHSPGLVTALKRIAWGSLAWVVIGGAIRGRFYMEYEWLEKAGTLQLPALVVKHILLLALTFWGHVGVVRLSRKLHDLSPQPTDPERA